MPEISAHPAGDETLEKLQKIRVKFLRLAHRLGQTPHNDVVSHVLYKLDFAEAEHLNGTNRSKPAVFNFDGDISTAEQLEASSSGQNPLDFSCTILVLGISGVGKSATINSIFDDVKFDTHAFESGTEKVQEAVGTVQGINVRVIDTPGLLPSLSDQCKNETTLKTIRRHMKKTEPDIVLYLDRLDMPSWEFEDMQLLKTVTKVLGPSIWLNAIVVLTHGQFYPPPEEPNSYEMFVTQRSRIVQQAIYYASGHEHFLMNPIALVENHPNCSTNRDGNRVLPNGQVWKTQLLLLCFGSTILGEAKTLSKSLDTSPPPYLPLLLLSSLLERRISPPSPLGPHGDDFSNPWLVKPVTNGSTSRWDHEVDFGGINVEKLFIVTQENIPISFSGQFSKDKKQTHLQMDLVSEIKHWEEGKSTPVSLSGRFSKDIIATHLEMEMASTIQHGEGKSTSLGLDLQSVDNNNIIYTLRSETRFRNWRRNEPLAGLSLTLFDGEVAGGLKFEDKLTLGEKGHQMVVSGGAIVAGNREIACGGTLEATQMSGFLSKLGLCALSCGGDLAVGCNLVSQFIPVGWNSTLNSRVSVNNKGSGQVSVHFKSSQFVPIVVLFAVFPLVRKLLSRFQYMKIIN
ncbi:OLC1v1036489C1 [Oldenlandia corymbosa var. corymbosa]|uniref:OLC1v1036489C1 n=1 Tax=Oldenlandia corymbosa var. corymbosa TaxID=529605 RepID=A0AAV1CW04_OLDCO|nr:OLC1v1036489C1 [Oldenlandia corymbosa var. corymbosa]